MDDAAHQPSRRVPGNPPVGAPIDQSTDASGTGSSAIILIAAALMAVGLVMVGSATVSLDQPLLGPRLVNSPLGRQMVFVVCGLMIALGTARFTRWMLASPAARRWIPWTLYASAVGLLVLVLLPGMSDASHGSQRWLRFSAGGIALGIQPSEIAKLGLIAFLAYLLAESGRSARSFVGGFVPACLAIGVCVGLVGKENLGTAAVLACAAGAVLVAAGCRIHHLVVLVGLGTSGMVTLLFAESYRLARLTAFRDIWSDPTGAGYQPLQSLATIASGGWTGVGLGSGLQKYGYLPESHTDFVFAILCEELGVVGAGMVILLFCGLVWMGMRIALRARTPFEFLLAFGVTALLGMQAAMNIAVVTVVTPTTGVPLPFISAGGSGLFTACAAIGVLSAIATRSASDPVDATEGEALGEVAARELRLEPA